MTEKRFTFTQDTLAKADVFDGDEFVCCTLSVWVEQLVELLNQLNDENEQLKEKIKGFESCSHNWSILYDEAKNKVEVLSKENKILKSLLYRMADRNGEIWLDDGSVYRLEKVFERNWCDLE